MNEVYSYENTLCLTNTSNIVLEFNNQTNYRDFYIAVGDCFEGDCEYDSQILE